MEKFTSIEAFKNTVAKVRKFSNNRGKPFPTLNFEGTVKLHGSNAGIRRTKSGKIQAQSRERILDVTSDNYGFAFFVETNMKAIEKLFTRFPADADVTLFGEWCGAGIQKSVALVALEKHLVLFKVLVNGEYQPLPRDLFDNENKVFNIYQIPTYKVEVDFLSPEPASEILAELTLAVEEKCPWAAFRGVTGENDQITIGEGIVWECIEHPEISDLWFKTKGMLHKGNDKTKGQKIKIDDQKLASIKELVEEILPQWRLEQGVTAVKEEGLPVLPQSTGDYLKWIAKDILKEELETIAASGFDWKGVQGQVMQTARQYWLTECNKFD
jgi:hypothetical protein